MCANYTPPPPRALRERLSTVQLGGAALQVVEPDFSYAAEVYPAGAAPVLWPDAAQRPAESAGVAPALVLRPRLARFGLLPGWARDDKLMRQTYNARSETVASKPSFRHAWRQRQFCLIPVQTFFEPCYDSGSPVRWRIERGDGAPFCVAGLWESALRTPQPSLLDPTPVAQQVHSFTMLTVTAEGHALMARFHAPGDEKRSIVALSPDEALAWLQAARSGDEAQARALLQPVPAQEFVSAPDPRPVRRRAG
jgi:putative SOS response-associated peptidase YedK